MQFREPATGTQSAPASQEAIAPGGLQAGDLRFDTLGDDDNVAYCLSADLRLTYMNRSWFRFARDNGGESVIERFGIGSSILEAIGGSLRDFYARAYAHALAGMKVREHDYECSSVATYRVFHQTAYPLRDGSGLVVMNTLAVIGAIPVQHADAPASLMRDYCDAGGLITQCSHCRRVQRADPSGRWDRVAAWVERMPENTRHGLCAFCFEYYYGRTGRSVVKPPA
jgi:hypothetical protein